MHLSQIPHRLQKPSEKPQVVVIRVSQPDKNGYVYTGLSLDIIAELVADPKVKVIAEMNPNMRRSAAPSCHQSHIDYMVKGIARSRDPRGQERPDRVGHRDNTPSW